MIVLARVNFWTFRYSKTLAAGTESGNINIPSLLRDVIPDKAYKIVGVEALVYCSVPNSGSWAQIELLKNISSIRPPTAEEEEYRQHGGVFEFVFNMGNKFAYDKLILTEPWDFDKDDELNLRISAYNAASASSATFYWELWLWYMTE